MQRERCERSVERFRWFPVAVTIPLLMFRATAPDVDADSELPNQSFNGARFSLSDMVQCHPLAKLRASEPLAGRSVGVGPSCATRWLQAYVPGFHKCYWPSVTPTPESNGVGGNHKCRLANPCSSTTHDFATTKAPPENLNRIRQTHAVVRRLGQERSLLASGERRLQNRVHRCPSSTSTTVLDLLAKTRSGLAKRHRSFSVHTLLRPCTQPAVNYPEFAMES